jgi:hypothetical protein
MDPSGRRYPGRIGPAILPACRSSSTPPAVIAFRGPATVSKIGRSTKPASSDAVYQAVASRQPDKPPDVIIPPRSSAAPGAPTGNAPSQRDRHIRAIAEKGRMAWQKATGYGRRSLIETAIGRYKSIIGSRLRARTFAAQQGEVAIAVEALNRMIRIAKPISVRVA